MRAKRAYRVVSTHEIAHGPKKGQTYTRTRHFFTQYNAHASYHRLCKLRDNWEKAHSYYFSSMAAWGKPVEVRFDVSEPIFFKRDQEMFEAGLDT